MTRFKKTPKDINPRTYEKIASRGFKAALRMLASKRDEQLRDSLVFLSETLGRDVIQMESYLKFGLPDHLVPKVIEVLNLNHVRFFSHQLRPNSSMVRQADLNARNTSAGGQVRSK